MKKGFIKRVISFVVLVLLLFSYSASDAIGSVEASGKMKTLKKNQYSKLIEGGMTKNQFETILATVTYRNPSGLTSKQLSKVHTKTEMINLIIYRLRGMEIYKSKQYKKQNYISIKEANKIMASFTSFRFKKNKKYSYSMYTDKKNVHMFYGAGYSDYIITKNAKYNNEKIVITYELHDDLQEENAGKLVCRGVYKATLIKRKNGKYRLNSIKKIK